MSKSRRGYQPKIKDSIPCGYCFDEWAYCYDHIIPVVYGGLNNKPENLFPACRRCNGIAGSKVFNSLEEKIAYVRDRLTRKYKWTGLEYKAIQEEIEEETTFSRMSELLDSIPTQEKVAEISQSKMPKVKLGKITSKNEYEWLKKHKELKIGICRECNVIFMFSNNNRVFLKLCNSCIKKLKCQLMSRRSRRRKLNESTTSIQEKQQTDS